MAFIFSQFCAIFALGCLCWSYFSKNRKLILILIIIKSVLQLTQFLLLGGYEAVATYAICIVQGIWFYFNTERGKNKDLISLIVISLAFVVSTCFTYVNWTSLLPGVAMLIYCYSTWQDNIKLYRWAGMLISPCMLMYNIVYKSPFGIASESIIWIIEIVGIVMLYVKKKEKNHEAIIDEDNKEKIIDDTKKETT